MAAAKAKGGGSTAYQARNQRARALGYRNYYDYRIHNHGKLPPSESAPAGEARARLRGHRSAADLEATVKAGTLLMVMNHSSRDADGRYRWVEIVTVSPAGREKRFRLQGAQLRGERLRLLVDRVEAQGGVLSPSPSLDLRRFAA